MPPILQICPCSSQTIGDNYDFEFLLVSKIYDSCEAVKSQTVWDFLDTKKRGFVSTGQVRVIPGCEAIVGTALKPDVEFP